MICRKYVRKKNMYKFTEKVEINVENFNMVDSVVVIKGNEI